MSRQEQFVIPAARLLPELRFEVTGNRLTGSVRFAGTYEGVGEAVHGGFICAVFDQFLGAVAATEAPGRTANLTVDFRSLTPIDTDLALAAEVDRVEGRKVWVSGTISAGQRLCAEARGLWVAVDHF